MSGRSQDLLAAIETQEALGQAFLVASDWLPADLDETEADYQALGIELGGPVADEPLFRHARLPPGWSRAPSPDTPYWTYLLDEQGEQRVAIFYKAAFYDRRAFMRIVEAA
jgi:hypothetical protein